MQIILLIAAPKAESQVQSSTAILLSTGVQQMAYICAARWVGSGCIDNDYKSELLQ